MHNKCREPGIPSNVSQLLNEWGKRRLAYPINYINDGYYVLVSFKSEPSFPRELDRVFGISDAIIRSMTTRKIEGAEVAASAPAAEIAAEAVAAEANAADKAE